MATSVVGDSAENSRESFANAPDSSENGDSSTKSAPKQTRLRGMKALANSMAQIFGTVTAHNLFEYEWPPNSAERYFLQEQLMEYLDIKSFKRKYPDLARRPVDLDERHFLRCQGVVSETLADLGLTALPSAEVLDLMHQDYPEKYEEYEQVLSERTKEEMMSKQRQMQSTSVNKLDKVKMDELRKKAVKAAAEWNLELNRDRHRERNHFCDVQTMVVQSASNRFTKRPASQTQPGKYPVALMPQQFQNYCKRFKPEELKRLPLNTVTEFEDLIPVRRIPSPGPIIVSEREVQLAQRQLLDRRESFQLEEQKQSPEINNPDINKEDRGEPTGEHCSFCRQDLSSTDRWLQCCQCGSCGHPFCMEMSAQMYSTAKQYQWMCIECKPCSVCSNLDQEDKMLFCDRCDRGYHTFCVGLEALPSGRWLCAKFCGGGDPSSGRSTPGNIDLLKKCKECDDLITRQNKVHHRSKYRHMGMCSKCVTKQQ